MTIAQDIARIKKQELQRHTAKILTLDIETSPNLAYVWSIWQENIPIDRLITPSKVMCVAAKWYDKEDVMFVSDFKNGHEEMILQVWDWLNEADVIETYNGDKFDLPHLNTEFVLSGLTPPSPYKSNDLYKAIKSRFKFTSNKMDFVAQQLGVGKKVKHSGFDMWIKCMAGDEEAWKEFEEYCKNDVVITQNIGKLMTPWVKNYPTIVFSEDENDLICPRCGSNKLFKTKDVTTKTLAYDGWICSACGTWLSGNKSTKRIASLRAAT